MLNEGLTFETPIRKMRVSVPGTHLDVNLNYAESDKRLTDIFTDGYSYVTAGSTVEFKALQVNGPPLMAFMSME